MTSTPKVKQRVGHRAYATKVINEARTLIGNDEIDEGKLISIQQILREKMQTLSTLDEEILETIELEADIVTEIDKSSEVRTQIQQAIISIEQCVGKKGRGDLQSRGPSLTSGFMNPVSNNAKLPKLSIKPFMVIL